MRTRFGFIYTFTAVWLLTILIAIVVAYRRGDRAELDGWLAAMGGALLGGRLAFIAVNWLYFQDHGREIWRFSDGGLGYIGVLVGGCGGLWVWARWRGRGFGDYIGGLGMIIPLLHFGGWAACYFDGCAFGRETVLSWVAADLPDNFGVLALRYQTQMGGMIIASVVLALSWWRGWSFRAGLALMLIGQGVIAFWRGDEALLVGSWRLDLGLSLLGGIMLAAVEVSSLYATAGEEID